MSARLADISQFSPFNEIFAVPMSIQQPDLFASGTNTWVAPEPPIARERTITAHTEAGAPSRKSTSALALASVDRDALAASCMWVLGTVGPMTADEVAAHLGLSILSIRPRITELSKAGLIVKTGLRRANISGCNANEWRAV